MENREILARVQDTLISERISNLKMNCTMKRIVNILVLVAVAAMGFTACQKEIQGEVNPNGDTVTVNLVAASADTKTSVDTSGDVPVFAWGETETFAVLEQTDALAEATAVTYTNEEGKAKIAAEFAVNAGKGEYKYVAVYPKSGYVSASSLSEATLVLPADQTMADGSYDPDADLMVSEVVATAAQPTEAQMVRFTRLAAVVKMSLKNFGVELGDKVQTVTFAADGKVIAGQVVADLADPHGFVAGAETVSSVTVETESAGDVYFTALPAVLEAGDTYTVTVITEKKLYVKKGTIPEGKTLEFAAGMVTRFGVDMSAVVPSDKWVLVRDASTLKQGDVVTIAAKDYDMAISKKLYSNASETSTSARRDAVAVSKYQDYLLADENVQPFTLVTGAAAGTFSFYDEARAKFLVSNNKTSRYLINQAYVDLNTSFAVTIDAESGDATVKNTEGDYKDCMIRYYNSSKYFYSGTSANQAVCIYRLEGAAGAIPVVAANVTVPDADDPVVIAEEGAQTATPVEEVVFNYVGDWNVSVSASESWLTVSYADGVLSYTAEANAGGVREAVVTITATREGSEPLSWTVNVLQKGAPQEITIAEFMTKEKNENVTYKLTGKITEMSSSSSGTFKLTDGTNVATVTYLYTDGGEKVYGDDTIGLEVGDVVTVTTVVASTTKGKGGSSAYHSIYKGHYGLKAIAGVAAEYTGGTVAIEVTTKNNGNIVLPETVTAAIAENDFAELSYNGGGQATVTFPSENTTSDAREAEVTFTYGMASVTVIAEQGINPANKLGYELVTDASTLAVGDEVIIVAMKSEKALGCLASTASATGVSTIPAVDIEKTGNVIYDADKLGVMLLTLKAGLTENEFAFQFSHKGVDYYINAPSSGLKGRAASSGANNSTSYAITIDPETGDATAVSTYPRIIKFNSKTGTNFTAFKMDAEGASLDGNQICIYKKQTK